MLKPVARILSLLCLVLTGTGYSQDLDSLLNMSAFTEESDLQKTLNRNLTVSSAKALTTRETPGIISLVTAEEIQNAGARDLIDILRLVPGFDVAQDLSFVTGIGLRGNWSNEGKVLLMLDGQPFNDLLYQGVALGNHFPVDAVERIEIIRGPGSALYGGSAEYGVINIVTKAAENLNGVRVFGTGGFTANAVARTTGGVSLGSKTQNLDWDISFFGGKGIVSDALYTDIYRDTVEADLRKSSNADPMNFNAGLRIQDFRIRAMYDQFKTSEPMYTVSFKNFFLDARYDWKLNDKITITPILKYFNQVPWQFQNTTDSEDRLEVHAQRYYASAVMNYNISRKINLNSGLIYFQDKANDALHSGYLQGEDEIQFNNVALFAEALFKHRLANTTLGFRYERNSQYGSAFVPRLALTKKIENFHFKILYSQAFRAPSIENINLAEDADNVSPEKSQVVELELGYQFTPEMLLAINSYMLKTKDVIVYGYSQENTDGFYFNSPKTGSRGFELVYSIRKKGWYSNLTYSFGYANKNNSVESYAIPGVAGQFVGMARHKLTWNTNINLTPRLTVNPTVMWSGKRFAYTETVTVDGDGDGLPDVDEDGDEVQVPVIRKLDPYTLVNIFFNYRNIVEGLNIGLGVYDLLNERPVIPQAYNGDYAPVPGRSREFVVKLSYQLNFQKQ